MHFKDLVEKYTKLSAFIHMNRKVKKSKMFIQDDPIPEHASSHDENHPQHIDIATVATPMPASTTVDAATVTDDVDDEEDIEQKSDSNVNIHKRNENDDDHRDFLDSDDKGNFNIRCVGAAFQVCNSFHFVFI